MIKVLVKGYKEYTVRESYEQEYEYDDLTDEDEAIRLAEQDFINDVQGEYIDYIDEECINNDIGIDDSEVTEGIFEIQINGDKVI